VSYLRKERRTIVKGNKGGELLYWRLICTGVPTIPLHCHSAEGRFALQQAEYIFFLQVSRVESLTSFKNYCSTAGDYLGYGSGYLFDERVSMVGQVI